LGLFTEKGSPSTKAGLTIAIDLSAIRFGSVWRGKFPDLAWNRAAGAQVYATNPLPLKICNCGKALHKQF